MKKILIAMICCCAQPASAALLVYEPFDYPSGSALDGLTNTYSQGNPTWAAAGVATTPVHEVNDLGGAGSLVGPSGFPASAGNAGVMMNADSTQYDRLALPQSFGANTTVYYSLLLNVPSVSGLTVPNTNLNANNDGIIAFNNGTGGGSRPSNWAGELVIRLGSVADTYNLGIRASNTPAGVNPGHTYWSGDLSVGTTNLVVVQYAQGAADNSGSDDLNSLWINPNPLTFGLAEGSVPAPDGSSQGTINASSPMNNFATSIIVGAGIAAGAAPNQTYIDEIRVGTTWADVTGVPEPGSLGLLLMACLGIGSHARRFCS